jgi:hypothetical protein
MTPRLTKACPPWASMCATTPVTSASVADGAMTMTMAWQPTCRPNRDHVQIGRWRHVDLHMIAGSEP